MVILEACIDSVESALAAQEGGADRVELCANLMEGGTTPSAGSIRLTRARVDIDVNVMIRPRGGDFCYSAAELEVMRADVDLAGEAGVNGVVFGLLTEDGQVDRVHTAELIEYARPLSVTFHRAFDMTRDPIEALEALIELGVDRILTSGQENSVLEGLDLISELVDRAGDRIIIMPGCGITERNLKKIVSASNAREFHVAAWGVQESRMTYRHSRCFMGGELRPPEFSLSVTEAARMREFARLAH
jgi:copper homeostasis protein